MFSLFKMMIAQYMNAILSAMTQHDYLSNVFTLFAYLLHTSLQRRHTVSDLCTKMRTDFITKRGN